VRQRRGDGIGQQLPCALREFERWLPRPVGNPVLRGSATPAARYLQQLDSERRHLHASDGNIGIDQRMQRPRPRSRSYFRMTTDIGTSSMASMHHCNVVGMLAIKERTRSHHDFSASVAPATSASTLLKAVVIGIASIA
jgi:hypothetical protein